MPASQHRRKLRAMPSETFLQVAERHVVEGELRVTNQRAVVARLQAHGLDTGDARKLLAVFEEALRGMAADLEAARKRAGTSGG